MSRYAEMMKEVEAERGGQAEREAALTRAHFARHPELIPSAGVEARCCPRWWDEKTMGKATMPRTKFVWRESDLDWIIHALAVSREQAARLTALESPPRQSKWRNPGQLTLGL